MNEPTEFITNCTVVDVVDPTKRERGWIVGFKDSFHSNTVIVKIKRIGNPFGIPTDGIIMPFSISTTQIIPDDDVIIIHWYNPTDETVDVPGHVSWFQWYQEGGAR